VSRRQAVPNLVWKFDDGFHFAHSAAGMWTIEQRRGRFLLSLDLPNTHDATHDATQDVGNYTTSAKAKSAAQRHNRIIVRDLLQ